MNPGTGKVGSDFKNAIEETIRVLFVSHDVGMVGAQRTLLTLLSSIDRRRFSPLLVVPYDGPLGRKAAELGIPVFVEKLIHWVPGSLVASRRERYGHIYRFFKTLHQRCRSIERVIEDNGADIVYTNTVTCVEGAIAAQRTRKPHVWHIHEPILRNSELAPLFPFQFYSTVVNILSTSVIFCSRALAREYPRLFHKASLVYNGLPSPPVRDRIAAKAKVLSDLGIDDGVKLVAIVGALQPRKDHLNFLAAAKQIARRVEEAIFLIVGSGYENNEHLIRQRIKDLHLDSKVRLLGWWEGDIHDLLAAIDVLVISSEQESFGLTAIEALAMETPVVATRCGGPEEVIEEGITGLLVPVKDPDALADATARLLLDPTFARRMGVTGKHHVIEHFGVDRYVGGIQQVIQRAVPFAGRNPPNFYSPEAQQTVSVPEIALPKGKVSDRE